MLRRTIREGLLLKTRPIQEEAPATKRRFVAYVGVAEYSGSKEYQWFKVGQGTDLTKLMDLVGSKVHGGNMTSHVIEVPSGVRAPKKYKGSGAALIKRVKGKSMGGVGGNLTGRW